MAAKHNYIGLDRFKIIAALLVIAVHTGPLTSYSEYADFLLTGILARLAVPFFFFVSGFFFFQKLTGEHGQDRKALRRFASRIGWLYLFSIALYLPLNWYAGHFADASLSSLFKDLVFNGTFYHLWYLPALILGMYITYFLYGRMPSALLLAVTGFLYLIGLLGDSYFGLAEQNALLHSVYTSMFTLFDYTRNGLFFAPVFLALGAWTARASEQKIPAGVSAICFALSLGMMFIEGMMLHALHLPRHDSMYVFLIPAVYFLCQLLLLPQGEGSRGRYLRQVSTWIYLLHPWSIVLVRAAGRATGLTDVLVADSLIHYVAVTVLSIVLSVAVVRLTRFRKKKDGKYRAWAEVNLSNLEHNLAQLQGVLRPGCGIMAVLKADAYGHGSVQVARRLNKAGVRHFAVAEVAEGIALRKHGIKGEILVLGYTAESRFGDLTRYKLTQTVICADYAEALQKYGKQIKAHVKIDTGMGRLGENHENFARICSMYRHKNVQVTGTFTHLSASDSLELADVAYTHRQIERFNEVIDRLRVEGIHPGVLHVQSSYGILHYPDMEYELARPGIALYGLLGNEADTDRVKRQVDLRPVLSLKARVAHVRDIKAKDPVGYSRRFLAKADSRIATVSIGYADGIPRDLSETGGYVLIRGQRAPIAGNICMDQLMVDVTHIEGVRAGDTVTLIGQDGEETITAAQIAGQNGTIANEILSRIGNRVVRVYQ
ncbi:serine racemase VanT catalytic subunit [Brevibacillus massiliensis]|uniref:serine racemase VanT catalytic subunit n=1 Tax=Brevibacillus massiliensis TaxID=1118054 RepID=UPI0002FE1402|nr:serine racemase VanT catalytic subunit [Brevibacillus massiliensis]